MSLRFTSIAGQSSDLAVAEKLHTLGHEGKVEYLTISGSDLARKRLRVHTDKGTECAIALPRSMSLEHGAVLELSKDRAIVVQVEELPWLTLEAIDTPTALRVGFLAGHHHWRVKFSGTRMQVALDGPQDAYTDRLRLELDAGSVRIVEAADA